MIAEMTKRYETAARDYRLQWGRDQMIAEIQRRHFLTKSIPKLQWGRDQMIAEMPPVLPSAPPNQRFNGAAIK